MNESDFNNGLLEFLNDSPTPFHAVKQLKQLLTAEGFEQLAEHNSWTLKPGGCYFVVRNGSSIAAIRTGSVHPTDGGLRLIGTHTDSPCQDQTHTRDQASGLFAAGCRNLRWGLALTVV